MCQDDIVEIVKLEAVNAKLLEKIDHEISENERGLRGPVKGEPYWKGRLNGLWFAREAIKEARK